MHHPRRNAPPFGRRSLLAALCACVALGVAAVAVAVPARAATRPTVTSLSRHQGPYWGATRVTVHGTGFDDVSRVLFQKRAAYAVHVVSSTELTLLTPDHRYGTVHVRVITPSGASRRGTADLFTFTRPTMNTPIMGGLTARQEQRLSARVRAAHHGVFIAPRRRHWTAAMGRTALARARSWLGLPYSWAGGNGAGPTYGVCAHNGGDLDCHVIGFDCSGLALYAWSPYESLAHYAATQHAAAGRFHPAMGELVPGDLVFFSGYIAGGIGHVAVYAGNGMVIQAAQSGTTVMRSRLADVIAESGVYRGATRPMSTGRQGPAPTVASVTPQLPVTGGTVRITGRNLGSTTAVSVGGRLIYHFLQRTPRHLVVAVPGHAAGPVAIRVSDAWGTAQRTLTYVAAPAIRGLSPATGPTDGGTLVHVAGARLDTVTAVSLDGRTVPFDIVGPRRLTFTTPPHAAGTASLVLTSRFGPSNTGTFTYAAPTPSPTPSTTPPPSTTAPPSTTPPPTTASSAPGETAGPVGTLPPPSGEPRGGDRIGADWYLVGRRYVARH